MAKVFADVRIRWAWGANGSSSLGAWAVLCAVTVSTYAADKQSCGWDAWYLF